MIGEILRNKRESKNLLLREAASALAIDQALLSKIERNERKATRDQVILFAKFYGLQESELISEWLSDKIIDNLCEDPNSEKALERALKKIRDSKDGN
ncbi:MAG TPA: transcriptional regulator [Cytophagales bacterium]|nr:transcriptional regulator [Cytophagales bacterium]HAP59662.1 transcriptional regulator [Cytophagales bacterium]